MMSCGAEYHLGSTVTLNDGVVMPMYGLGTSRIGEAPRVEKVVQCALQEGYKMIDTAIYYGTEKGVAMGIEISGVKREEIFLVTKVWEKGKQQLKTQLRESLQNLDTSYIDLYLIHHPLRGQVLQTYDAMLEMKKQGYVKSVGVSNFGVHHLEALRAAGRPLPSVNQIELHVFQQNSAIVDYCRKNNILVMGYSPLAKMQKAQEPYLLELAAKYKKNLPQVMLRWSLQNDFVTIPKTGNPERVRENADVFDFKLSDEEMTKLAELDCSYKCTFYHTSPTEAPWKG